VASNITKLHVHESVHRDTTMKATNKMQLCRLIYYSKSALHVSGEVFAHHQENLSVCTVSGSIHLSSCRLAMNVGPCHHGMARPQVADGGTASYMEGSCE
jgi:hypothetical protein